FGLLWLSQFKNILGSQTVLQAGLFPFLIGDLAKLILATVLLPTGWRLINRHKS
ncbi:MAG TPA: biotin transporter BioY, partial [Chloroflexi bacterium]|nr:biotin transporter BioY [Chloroflexota bacterium]